MITPTNPDLTPTNPDNRAVSGLLVNPDTDSLSPFRGRQSSRGYNPRTVEEESGATCEAPDLSGLWLDLDALGPAARTRVARAFRYDFSGGFIRGDATADGAVDIADPVAILVHLFRGVPLGCLDAADADDGGTVDLTDAVRLLEHHFRGGPSPAAPFPGRGSDATADGLECPGADGE